MPNQRASAPRSTPIHKDSGLRPEARTAPAPVSVLLPLPLSGAYDYLAPDDLRLGPGDVVHVPLGNREVAGVVWDRAPDAPEVPEKRLKAVTA
ncbi:MAG: primosomal protein N', partial [Kiloniellales bacterium]